MKRKLIFVAILVFGLALRLYAFDQIAAVDRFTWIGGDEPTYYELASNIRGGRGPVIDFIFQFWERTEFGQNDALWEPLFPYTLASFFHIFGQSILTAHLVVLLFSVLTLALIYFIGKAIYNEDAGLVSAFLLAIQPKHIEYSVRIMKDNLYVFLFLLAFFLMILAFRENRLKHWLLAGFALGLAFLARYFTAVLILAFLVLLAENWKKVNWKFVFCGSLVFLAVLAPWAAYTYASFGRPFFSVAHYYPYSSSSWQGMSYESAAPTLARYLQENSFVDILKTRFMLLPLMFYYLPIWFTPVVFVFFVLIFFLKDAYSRATGKYFAALILLYAVQFASTGQFIERAFFALMFISLVPISHMLARLPGLATRYISSNSAKTSPYSSGKHFAVKGERIIFVLTMTMILFSSLWFLQWKLNEIREYNMQEQQEAFGRLGAWVQQNAPEESIILTILPADIHYHTQRRTVMDPYNFALNARANITEYRYRGQEEREYYNATHLLLHSGKNSTGEGYLMFNLQLIYSDETAELFLYRLS